jgi:peptidoglycan/xylan/chitin deacetylase (PgdA/CDA1 family)
MQAGTAVCGGFLAAFALSAWVPRPLLFELGLGPWPVWRLRGRDIALTFDDGPHPDYTPSLLDELSRAGVTATFFVSTSQALRHPETIHRARREGHVIGCHGMTHTPLAFRGRDVWDREVREGVRRLEDLLGEPVHLFRPPYGVRSPGLYRVLKREGLRPVYWGLMAFDWRAPPPRVIARRVSGARPGTIVLLHDGGGDRRATVQAVPLIVEAMRRRDLKFTPVAAWGHQAPVAA